MVFIVLIGLVFYTPFIRSKSTRSSLISVSNSTITKVPDITTINFRLSSVITLALHHTGYHFFLLEHVLVPLLLGPEEPYDGQHYVMVGEGGGIVEADSAERPSSVGYHVLG